METLKLSETQAAKAKAQQEEIDKLVMHVGRQAISMILTTIRASQQNDTLMSYLKTCAEANGLNVESENLEYDVNAGEFKRRE